MKNILSILFIGAFAIFGTVLHEKLTYNVSVSVKATLPANHPKDTIFIAGNFNNWSPDATPMKFDASDSMWHVTVKGLSGNEGFKFTRGNWSKVQCSPAGDDVDNFKAKIQNDTLLVYQVQFWKDSYEVSSRINTASDNVQQPSKIFHIPSLNTDKKIWIYLPPGYKNSTRRYPVLYMQDGQNLFDDLTSFSGEWQVDETLDSLIKIGVPPSIVVGIENGKERMREYNPYSNERFGEGEGEAYLNFLAEDLKPWIDQNYRTLPSKENTAIAGSSMGGLISYYAALTKTSVFGKAGIFSPSFWIAPQLNNLTDSLAANCKTKMFFSIGRPEGEQYVDDMTHMIDLFAGRSNGIVYSFIDEEGEHNEAAWARAFPAFYKWIMASGANVILKVKQK